MKRADPIALAVSALLALGACKDDSTAIVLEVDSELHAGALDNVVFHVQGAGLGATGRRAEVALDGAGVRVFPLSLALVRDGDGAGPFTATISGGKLGEIVARAVVVAPADPEPFGFRMGAVTTRRYLFRVQPSAAVDGGAPPADAGAALADAGSEDASPVLKRDAAADPREADAAAGPRDAASADVQLPPAPTDASSCRAGCACVQTCGKGDDECVCENACGCAMACRSGGDCKSKCSGAGTTCQVAARGASNADLDCTGAASCLIDGRGPGTSNLNVTCKGGSQCQIDCTGGVSNCKPSCTGDASCLLRCGAEGNCEFEKCEGGEQSCGGGVFVCNRACP